MLYSNDINRLQGEIYLFKVYNKHTRSKFYKLEQCFSQRFVHVLLIHKNNFLFVLNKINFY